MIEKEWTYKGFPCVVRVVEEMGHRCGYVGLPKGHPYFGKKDVDAFRLPLSVHGGITYGKGGLEEKTPDTWWLGFDCNHVGDLPDPGFATMDSMTDALYWHLTGSGAVVWSLPMVMEEKERLADQLADVEGLSHVQTA